MRDTMKHLVNKHFLSALIIGTVMNLLALFIFLANNLCPIVPNFISSKKIKSSAFALPAPFMLNEEVPFYFHKLSCNTYLLFDGLGESMDEQRKIKSFIPVLSGLFSIPT